MIPRPTKEHIQRSRDLFKRNYGEEKANMIVCLPLIDKEGIPKYRLRKCHKCKGDVIFEAGPPKDMAIKRPNYICTICLLKQIDSGEVDGFSPEMMEVLRGNLV